MDSASLSARTRLALLALFIPVLLIQAALAAGLGYAWWPLLGAAALVAVALGLEGRGASPAGGLLALAAVLGGPLLLVIVGPSVIGVVTTAFLGMGALAALLTALTLFPMRSVMLLALVLLAAQALFSVIISSSAEVVQLELAVSIMRVLAIGTVVCALLIFRSADMALHRAADQTLRASEERYRRIAGLAGDLIYNVKVEPGPAYRINWIGGRAALARFTDRLARGELTFADFVHPDDLARLNSAFAAVLHGESASLQLRVQSGSGDYRWALMRAFGGQDAHASRLTDIYGLIEDVHDEVSAERALRDERARYEELVNSIDGVVYEINAETRETRFISRQANRLLGYSTDDFMTNRMLWIERIHPDDVARVVAYAKANIDRRQSFEQAYRMVAADGATVWVRELAVVKADPGQPVLLRGLALNETASREAQRAEQAQRRLREALRETTAAVSATLDLDEVVDRIFAALQLTTPADAADIMFIDHGVARLYRARDFKGNADLDRMLRVELPIATTPNLRQMVETGRPKIVDDVTTDENWVAFVEANWIGSTVGVPIHLEDQTIGFLNLTSTTPRAFNLDHADFLQTFADQIAITVRNARLYDEARRSADRLAAQVRERTAELELERERLSVMLDSTAEGIYYTLGQVIRYVNPAFCAMLGYRPDELIGQPVSLLSATLPDEERQRRSALIHEALRTERVWRGEYRYARKDGSVVDCGVTISSIATQDLAEPKRVIVARDISREKALQAQQSNLVAYASHELRTPITNLKTRLYLLRRRPELLDEHVQILEEVTDRMRRLVEDLLDLTRMERGISRLDRRITDLVELTRSNYRLQLPEADRKGLHFTCELPDEPLYADVDPERITQVITNLITNALNYTPDGGFVTLSVTVDPGEQQVVVRVVDSGVGIAADALPYIFQPFYRVVSAVEGAGLGLSIAREIVELHGGEIGVQSTAGGGSTFTVHLPLVAGPVPAAGD